MNFKEDHQIVHQRGTDAGEEIVNQKPACAPGVFHGTAEHPKGEHIEEDMFEIGVHEHIGDKLPDMEIGCADVMQSQPGI